MIFVLTNIEPYEKWYDKARQFVISAESEQQARKIAARHSGDEGPGHWHDSTKTTCVVLDKPKCGVICRDFMAA